MSEIQIITQDKYVGRHPFNFVQSSCQRARDCDHKFWVNGLPVTKMFYQFLAEFKASCRWFDVVLCVDKPAGERIHWGDESYGVWNHFGVASADAPNTRVGQLFVSDNYCVQSPRIENEKFNMNNDGYRIRKSKDMKKMLKVARQFLKPPTLDMLYRDHQHEVNSAVSAIRGPALMKFRDKFGIDKAYIVDELAHMMAIGYVPATRAFREAIDLMQTEGAELKRLKDYAPRTCFVWAKQNSVVYRYSDSTEEIEIVDLNDLPSDLNHKLGVLNIAAKGSPIADVGVRVTDEIFWVFV